MVLAFQCPHCACAHSIDASRAGSTLQCRQCGQAIQAPGSPPAAPHTMAPGGSVTLLDERIDMPVLTPPPTRILNQITRHIDRTIGYSPMVFHEIISTDIHLDLHIVPPHEGPPTADHPYGRNFYTIVTSGMSARPVPAPPSSVVSASDACECQRHFELMIALPGDWPGLRHDGTFVEDSMSEEDNWWPIRWLKMLARLPHENDMWVGAGCTVPNHPPEQSYAPHTGFSCMLLMPSALHPASRRLVAHDDLTIEFLALWPLYPEEMALKLQRGLGALRDAFAEAHITDLVDNRRRNVARSA